MTQTPDSAPPDPPAPGKVPPRKPVKARKRLLQEIGRSPRLLQIIGRAGAGYMRLVASTSSMRFDPPDALQRYLELVPVIVTTWHGQHFFATTFWPVKTHPLVTLISMHRDGEMMAALANGVGIGTVRGSGGRDPKRAIKSGAIRGFLQLKSTLESGVSIFMTADISRGVSGRAGPGIIKLAQVSGRPIMGIGVASAPEIRMENWDKSRIALPFGKTVCMVAEPIEVPPDAGEAEVEAKRVELEAALKSVTARAYAAVGRKDG